jgi:CRP-like cAMP-binding protein
MYFIARGEVEVLDEGGRVLNVLGAGHFFGETSLLLSAPRTASVRATTQCDVYILDKTEFGRVLKEHPEIAQTIRETSEARHGLAFFGDRP